MTDQNQLMLPEALGLQNIQTERLTLSPLRAEDADEMLSSLDDVRLHNFVGGQPGTLEELRTRYARLIAGSDDPGVLWLNWIVRSRSAGTAIGTVQATISEQPNATAEIAWVIGVEWQGRGFAIEAATALVGWLRAEGVTVINAHIHPDHSASAAVARRIGLSPTTIELDGEILWQVSMSSGG